MKIEEIVKERIKNNEKLFNEEEMKVIKEDYIIINKVYMLGMMDNININKTKI